MLQASRTPTSYANQNIEFMKIRESPPFKEAAGAQQANAIRILNKDSVITS